MQCLDDVAVLDYLEARASIGTTDDIRDHISGCPHCLNLVEQLSQGRTPRAVDGLELGRTISSGGMGLIVEAYDTKLERRIALKLPRTDDPALQRRFEREVKITARLQHPAIMPVYAAGSLDDTTPYYAMRLVDGVSLDTAIERAETVGQRVALVRVVSTVADAVAYAHSQSIIHRDIKPANVLVGPFGEVVVIDWGLARALGDADTVLAAGSPGPLVEGATGPLGEGSPGPLVEGATVDGTVLGTPAYMAPEQARGEALDERADVYSLGAMLYHVLRGRPPGRSAPGDLAGAELPADLIAIVAKAMAADPAQRYRSAKELATDLERFQTGRLVAVHRYSVWQLARRWIAKHRAVVAVAAVLSVVLAVTAIVATRRIGTAEQTATTQRAASDDLVAYMLADLQKRLTKVGKLDILEGIGTRIDGYYVKLGKSTAALSATDVARWSSALDILGDVAQQAGDLTKAKGFYERALAGRRELAAKGALKTDVLEHIATSHGKLAKIQYESGDVAGAVKSYAASRDTFAELAKLKPAETEPRRMQVDAMVQIGIVQAHNDPKAAIASLEAALAIADKLAADAPQSVPLLTLKLSVVNALSGAAEHIGDLDRAADLAKRGVASAEAIAKLDTDPKHQLNLSTLNQRVGAVAEKRGDRAGALAAFKRSAALLDQLTKHDPNNATWKSWYGTVLSRVGDSERALGRREETTAAYEQSLAIRKALVDSDPKNLTWLADLAGAHGSLATLDFDVGDFAGAERHYKQALAIAEQLVRVEPNSVEFKFLLYASCGNMGEITHARGEGATALRWYKRRVEAAQSIVNTDAAPPHKFWLSNAYENLSMILMDTGDAPAAREAAQQSLAIREELVKSKPDHAQWKGALAMSLQMLAQAQDDPKQARELIGKAAAHQRELVKSDPSDIVQRADFLGSLMIQGRITRDLGDLDAAAATQAEALPIAKALLETDPKNALLATYLEQALEIGGDIAALRKRNAEAAQQYRAALATLEPFLDPGLGDPHIASEIAEAKFKLSKVVAAKEAAPLARDAINILERLKKTKRLAPDREKLLAQMR
ncbi:MAG TPA: serine/threonine-protein kinase [Kofleriaceae bacterium]